MGREWYWGGSRSSKRGGGGGGGGAEKDTATSGCMCAVFQLFDFPHVQFALNQHHPPSFNTTSLHPEELTVPEGVEAPRNSLDSSEGTSLSSITKEEEENLNSPSMGIQIKTSGGTTSTPDMSSPGTKTPNLVARLMGLELLPETHSPSSTSSTCSSSTHARSSSSHSHPLRPRKRRPRVLNVMDSDHVSDTRSLPETPRISSARRSDVDHHHRLSLQINKENIGEEMEFSRLSCLRRKEILKIIGDHQESGKSPSHYARQIVKQVKETVTRKVGLTDITNTNRNRDREDQQSRDELLNQLKSKRKQVQESKGVEEASPGKHSSTPSCSPRLRFLESKEQVQPPKPKSPLSSLPVHVEQQNNIVKVSVKPKAEQKSQESFQKRRLSKKQQEEAFVRPSTATRAMNNINMPADKKCKKTPFNLNNVPTLLPVKKDPSPPATKLPPKQAEGAQVVVFDAQESKRRRCGSQLSSCSRQTYKQQGTQGHVPSTRDTNDNGDIPNGGTTTRSTTAGPDIGGSGSAAELRQYVTRILFRTGIDKDTPVSFTNWFAPSHPLDPSIFHRLENSSLEFSSQLGQRSNRRLVFHLADEILADILRPYINMKPWVTSDSNCNGMQMHGSQLIDMVCSKIQSFPCADCTLLEDIDALIDKDLPEFLKVQTAMAFEDQGEGVVWEIEKDVLDTLIHETAMGLWF